MGAGVRKLEEGAEVEVFKESLIQEDQLRDNGKTRNPLVTVELSDDGQQEDEPAEQPSFEQYSTLKPTPILKNANKSGLRSAPGARRHPAQIVNKYSKLYLINKER